MTTTGGETSQHLTSSASFFFFFFPFLLSVTTRAPFPNRTPRGALQEDSEARDLFFCQMTLRGVRARKRVLVQSRDGGARSNVDRACRGVPAAAECELHIPVSRKGPKRRKRKRGQRVWFRPRLHDICWEDARRGGRQHGSDAGFVSLESGDRQSSRDSFQLSG